MEYVLVATFALALVLLIANAIVATRAAQTLFRNENKVAHTLEVLTQLETILSTVQGAETGQRGFLITGRKTYLEPYQNALAQIDKEVTHLRTLTSDTPVQQLRIAKLEGHIHAKLQELKNTIDLRGRHGFDAAQELVLTNLGKREMDQIRQIVNEMEMYENELVIQRSAESKEFVNTTRRTFIIASAIAGIFLVLLAFLSIRGLNERRRNEQMISQHREWLHVTLGSIGDAVIATDASGHVVFLNGVAESLTGWSIEEAEGESLDKVFRVLNEQTRAALDNPALLAIKEGRVIGLANHSVLVAKNGNEIPIDDSGAPIKDSEGNVLGAVLVFRDITVRREGENEHARLLEREKSARAQAEEANRSKDDFLATISHELRTPLNAIFGWASLMNTNIDSEARKRAIQSIQESAKAQARLIEDLLDISRITSGKLRLNLAAVDLAQIIHSSIETVRPAVQAKGITLELELEPKTGAAWADATRIQQVLWNLLSNAAKFTQKGGRIDVRLTHSGSDARIDVCDNGSGIEPEFLPHLFERFVQADGRDTRSQGGLGIGLAIARHLVEMHGGHIRASSPGRGQGAVFSVWLPLTTGIESTEVLENNSNVASQSTLPDLSSVNVLLVEDDESTREALSVVFTQCSAQVRAVASAAEAMRMIAQSPPDVLVSDIGLPVENGYELVSRIRSLDLKDGGNIPAVAITAYARTDDRIRALKAGFQAYFSKPFDPAEVARIIASLTSKSSKPDGKL